MIDSREKLLHYIKTDIQERERLYNKYTIKDVLTYEHNYLTFKYQKLLRKDEYYTNTAQGVKKIIQFWYRLRKNLLGRKLGFTISSNVFSEGLVIWHYGNIVVNGFSRVGKNCILHGDNCIGNDGKTYRAPIIGDNVDIGVGAKIIGDIFIANNIRIGAGAVVVNSFYEEGVTIGGVPAKILT